MVNLVSSSEMEIPLDYLLAFAARGDPGGLGLGGLGLEGLGMEGLRALFGRLDMRYFVDMGQTMMVEESAADFLSGQLSRKIGQADLGKKKRKALYAHLEENGVIGGEDRVWYSGIIKPFLHATPCGRPLCGAMTSPTTAVCCAECSLITYCSQACHDLDVGKCAEIGEPHPDFIEDQDEMMERVYVDGGEKGGGHGELCGTFDLDVIDQDRAFQTLQIGRKYGKDPKKLGQGDVLLTQLGVIEHWEELEAVVKLFDEHQPDDVPLVSVCRAFDLLGVPEPRNGGVPIRLALFPSAKPGTESTTDVNDLLNMSRFLNAIVLFLRSRNLGVPIGATARTRAAHIIRFTAPLLPDIGQSLRTVLGEGTTFTPLARDLLIMAMAHTLVFDISGFCSHGGASLGLDREWVINALTGVWTRYRDSVSVALQFLSFRAAFYLGLFLGVTGLLFGEPIEMDKVKAHQVFEWVYRTASPLSVFHAYAMMGMAATPVYAHEVDYAHTWSRGEVALRSIRLAKNAVSLFNSDVDALWSSLTALVIEAMLPHVERSVRYDDTSTLYEIPAGKLYDLSSTPSVPLARTFDAWMHTGAMHRLVSLLRESFSVSDWSTLVKIHSMLEDGLVGVRHREETLAACSVFFGEAHLALPTPDTRTALSTVLDVVGGYGSGADDGALWEDPSMFRMEAVGLVFGLFRLVYGTETGSSSSSSSAGAGVSAEDLDTLHRLALSAMGGRERSDRRRVGRLAALVKIHALYIPFGEEQRAELLRFEVPGAEEAEEGEEGMGAWWEIADMVGRKAAGVAGGGGEVGWESVVGSMLGLSKAHPDRMWMMLRVAEYLERDLGRFVDVGKEKAGELEAFCESFVIDAMHSQFYYRQPFPWWTSSDAIMAYLDELDEGVEAWEKAGARRAFAAFRPMSPGIAGATRMVSVVFLRRVPGTWSVVVFGPRMTPCVLVLKVENDSPSMGTAPRFTDQDMDAVWDAVDEAILLFGRGRAGDVMIFCPRVLIDAHIHTMGTLPPVDREGTIASVGFVTTKMYSRVGKGTKEKERRLARGDIDVLDTFGTGPSVVFDATGSGVVEVVEGEEEGEKEKWGRGLAASAVSLAEGKASGRLMYWGVEGAGTYVLDQDVGSLVAEKWVVSPTWRVAKDLGMFGVLSSSSDAFLADLVRAVDISDSGWTGGTSVARTVTDVVRKWKKESEGGEGGSGAGEVLDAVLKTTVCFDFVKPLS